MWRSISRIRSTIAQRHITHQVPPSFQTVTDHKAKENPTHLSKRLMYETFLGDTVLDPPYCLDYVYTIALR